MVRRCGHSCSMRREPNERGTQGVRKHVKLAHRKYMNALIASASVPAPTPAKTIWLRCAGVPVRYRRMMKRREKRETRVKRTVSASRIWVFAVFEVCESGFQAARATPNDGHRRVAVDCD